MILRALLPMLVLSACAVPPPTAPPPVKTAPASPSPSADQAIVSVTVAEAPLRLVIDGDVAEWGSLLPRPPPPPADKPGEAAPAGAPPPDPNPRDAASHVAVAITGEGARIAADLGEAAREGIWLGLGSVSPDVPPIGEYKQVEGSETDPVMGVTTARECLPVAGGSAPYDPEKDATCQAYRRRRADLEAAHERRFRRFYRIDREGVRVAKDDGTLAAVEGARVVWKPGAEGATAEVSLPAPALPRLGEAPLARIQLVARAASTPKPPDLPDDRWVWLDLPAPVGFEPWAELRARAFEVSTWMSWHPGDPRHVETMRYPSREDRRSVVVRDEMLYVKQATLGAAEIGYLTIAPNLAADGTPQNGLVLAIVTKGAVEIAVLRGAPLIVREREGELHVLAYEAVDTPGHYAVGTTSSFGHATVAAWSAIAIGPDGKHHDVAVAVDSASTWDAVEEFHDEGSFGMRGLLAAWALPDERAGQNVELRWQWDQRKKGYVGKRRNLPAPRRAKAKTK